MDGPCGLCGYGDPFTGDKHFEWCDGTGHFAEGWRHLRGELPPSPVVHGTRWGYQRGCRCGECRTAESVYRAVQRSSA